eukprot:6173452-Pleurochrysis_carterae.AAC.3
MRSKRPNAREAICEMRGKSAGKVRGRGGRRSRGTWHVRMWLRPLGCAVKRKERKKKAFEQGRSAIMHAAAWLRLNEDIGNHA